MNTLNDDDERSFIHKTARQQKTTSGGTRRGKKNEILNTHVNANLWVENCSFLYLRLDFFLLLIKWKLMLWKLSWKGLFWGGILQAHFPLKNYFKMCSLKFLVQFFFILNLKMPFCNFSLCNKKAKKDLEERENYSLMFIHPQMRVDLSEEHIK